MSRRRFLATGSAALALPALGRFAPALADRLTAAFRPDPERMAAAAPLVGCGG